MYISYPYPSHTSIPFLVILGLGFYLVYPLYALFYIYEILLSAMSEFSWSLDFLKLACTLLRQMATLLPPPKRRKLYHGIPEPVKEPEPSSTSIVVQFVDEEDGKALAPAVNLPADLSREALESLLNKLSRQVIASTILDTRTSHFGFLLAGRRSSTVCILCHCTGSGRGIECPYSYLHSKFIEAGHLGQP